MKKLFTLFTKTLLVAVCLLGGASSAWADVTVGTYTTRTLSNNDLTSSWAFNVVTKATDITTETTDNEMVLVGTSDNKIKMQTSNFASFNGGNNSGGSEVYIPVPSGSAGTVSVTMSSGNDSRYFQLYVGEESGTNAQRLYSKLNSGGGISADGKKGPQSFSFTSSDITTKSGKTYLRFKSEIGEMKTASFTITLTTGTYATTPTLTGAWMIESTNVTGETTNLIQGGAASVPTFSVGATFNTPTTDNYTVVYSLKDGSADGIFTYTSAGGPTAISTSTTGTATIVATLTTKDASAFLTPATNTFEYTVAVSAAAAPTINITGTPVAAVAKGTEVTLTAAVTGNPTPTIQWYSNTTASTDGATELTGETSTTYSPSTAAAGTTYYYAVATNSVSSVTSSFQTVIVQEKLKAPTIDVANTAFVSSIDVTITDNSGKTATIKYSTDNGSSWSDYSTAVAISGEGTTVLKAKVVKDGYIESDEVTGSFKKVAALSTPATVSATTTWDWSKPSTTLQLSGTTIPNTSAADVCAADFDGTVYDAITWGDFNPAALVMSKFQYPVNASNDCFQGTSIKFTTTVPGTITVKFSNTGGGTRPNRYLYVNNSATEYKSNNTTPVTTAPINVAAGEIELKGVIKSADNNNEGDVENYLRIYSITFTPSVSVGTLDGRNYASYVTTEKLDFGSAEGITAYIATGLNSGETAVEMTPVNVVPAGTPIIVKTNTQGATVNVPVTTANADDVSGNKLVAGDGTTVANSDYYYLANDLFHLATSGTLQSGKAYLKVAGSPTAPSLNLGFDDATGIESIAKSQELTANGQYYNLAGQRVAQPTKGLYIVNGRKVIIK